MKKILLPMLLFGAFLLIPSGGTVRADALETEVLSTYEIDFSDTTAEKVNSDFFAAYVLEGGTPHFETVGQEEDGHWFLEDGALVRKNDIIEGGVSTSNVGVMTYRNKLYTNFRATVEYMQGPSTVTWAALAFRQLSEGCAASDDGGGAECFVQRDGKATVWGRYCGSEGAIESPADPAYDRNVRHSMTVEVIGNSLSLYVDGVLKNSHTLPSSFYYEGYISLLAINNDSRFYSLKIEELSEPVIVETPKHEPIPSAGTEDSLDRMAEKGDFNTFSERPRSVAAEQEGLSGLEIGLIAAGGALAAAGIAVGAWLLLKNKHHKRENP